MEIVIWIKEIANAAIVEILAGFALLVLLGVLGHWRLRRRVSILENNLEVQMNVGQINLGQINIGQQDPTRVESISSPSIDHIVVISQTEFDALPEKESRTLYLTTA